MNWFKTFRSRMHLAKILLTAKSFKSNDNLSFKETLMELSSYMYTRKEKNLALEWGVEIENFLNILYYSNSMKKYKYDVISLMGHNYMYLGKLYLELEDFEKSFKYAVKAQRIFRNCKDDKILNKRAVNYTTLGLLNNHFSKPEKSLMYFHKILNIHIERYLNDFGDLFIVTPLKKLEKLKWSSKKVKLTLKDFTYHCNYFCKSSNKFTPALDYIHFYEFSTILELKTSDIVSDPLQKASEIASNYNNVSTVYMSIKKLDLALDSALEAKSILEKIDKNYLNYDRILILYNNIGYIYLELNDLYNSRKYAISVYKVLKQIDNTSLKDFNIESNYSLFGNIYTRLGKSEKALMFYLKAKKEHIKISKERKINFNFSLAQININLSSIYFRLLDFDKSFECIVGAKNILLKTYKNNLNNHNLLVMYNLLSILYPLKKKYKKGYFYILKSLETYLLHRKKIFFYLNKTQKIKYNHSHIVNIMQPFLYTSLFLDNNVINKKEEEILKRKIFYFWLNYKGSISDFENIITILYNQTTDSEIKKDIEKREQLRKQLSYLYHSKEEDPAKQKMQMELSVKIEKEITQIENSLSQSSKELSDEMLLDKLTHQELASLLKEDELYIDYAFIEDKYYIFLLNHTGVVEFIRVEVDTSIQINNLLNKYNQDIQRCTKKIYNQEPLTKEDKSTHKAILKELYNLLITPYKDTIFNDNYNSYTISPDGALNLLPFDALYDGEKYLIETKNITYTPSGKEFVRLKRNQSNTSNTITLFANPNFDEEIEPKKKREDEESSKFRSLDTTLCQLGDKPFEHLKGTAKELEEIEKLFSEDTVSYQKENATKENFLAIKDTMILHCATHAFYLNCPETENSLLKTGIAFSGANTIDQDGKRVGVATGLELASMKLKGTELVVLSACDSATGDIEHSEGVAGLNKAFIQAGAKTVVASLWKASDSHTADFFAYTYQELERESKQTDTINYANLIRKAKLEFIENDKHPVFWGGFVVVG